MLRLIVNADDLGYSATVNDAIFDRIARGSVSSASLMANAPALEAALERVSGFPSCSFGIHLNVEEFAPLRPAPALLPILDEQGRFARRLRSARLTPSLLRAVHAEWCAQIERLRDRGVRLSHIDSHHHAHNLPGMLPVLAALRRRYGIRCARLTMNLFEAGQRKARSTRVKKALYNWALRHFCGFRTTAAFAYLRTAFLLPPDVLARLGSVELMAHPGHPGFEEETLLLERLGDGRLPPHELTSYDGFARG